MQSSLNRNAEISLEFSKIEPLIPSVRLLENKRRIKQVIASRRQKAPKYLCVTISSYLIFLIIELNLDLHNNKIRKTVSLRFIVLFTLLFLGRTS